MPSPAKPMPAGMPRGRQQVIDKTALSRAAAGAIFTGASFAFAFLPSINWLKEKAALFNVQCKSPRQMELANAFYRYLEMANVV